MNAQMPIGCFVTILNTNLGIGKLVQLNRSIAYVEWFTSISQREVREYDLRSVKRAYPSRQTRCYVTNEQMTEWEMGRIMGISHEQSKTGIEYDVHFAGGKAAYVPEEFVFVRCSGPPVDPIETLILRAHETPFFHDQRQKFLNSLVRQRSTAHGLTGLTSSCIELYPHQVEVVRRVLEDPVQRYLLADEVGLGKTIEAGIVLRQTWLDNPSASALVLVPPQLQAQWHSELGGKFGLDVSDQLNDEFEDTYVILCPTDQVHRLNPKQKYDIVVIDEAQHVTSEACHPDNRVLWETCRHFAHTTTKLLLLSATPAMHHEQEFLAMLHLLEPETYRLENIEAFRERVNARQPIGRLLLLFREGIPRPPLRRCIDTLRELFNKDPWVQEHARVLQSYCDADEFDREEVDLIIRALRVHICETYRIYRRMLRTARSSISSSTLSARAANPERPQVVEEFGFDERQTRLSRLLEEWRTTAVETIIMTNDIDKNAVRESLTDIFLILLQSAGMGLQVLQWAIECRLAGKKEVAQYQQKLGMDIANNLTRVPLIRDEDTLLRTMLNELSLEPDEGDKIDTIVELIAMQSRRSEKSVVFTSNTLLGREMVRRLRSVMSPKTVTTHLQDDSKESLYESLEMFRTSNGPMVLVCDKSGEEGLNLQFADNLIHFDLPWDPNRLEQRIGRLDRIGRSTEVHSHVFVAIEEGEEASDSIQEAWYIILRDGFRIFSQSIADLQFFIEKYMASLKQIALMEGARGLTAQLQSIQEAISNERKLIREQTSLDEIKAFDQDNVHFYTDLVKYDSQDIEIQQALEAWAVDALLFKRADLESDGPSQRDFQLARHSRPLVNYEYTERTLIPAHWWRQMNYQQHEFASFSRSQACQMPNTPILRIGHSFVDALADYINWDDRGKTFAMWRYAPELRLHSDLVFFQLDYILEADLTYVKELLNSYNWESNAERALSRRADAWLKPEYRLIYIDVNLQITEDPKIIDILRKPYRSFDNGGSDFNLNKQRQWALSNIISLDRWTEVCLNVRNLAEETIRQDNSFREYCEKSAESAKRDLDRRMEQLRRGLIYRTGVDPTKTPGCNIDLVIEEERQMYEGLILGIGKPTVKLDAVGVIVLSSVNPFAK